jgi:hypothetical protein
MKVLDHEPSAWFLLNEKDKYFLDANCNISVAGFSVAIELNPEEAKNYLASGRFVIEKLASSISYSPTSHGDRQLDVDTCNRMHNAVIAWKEASKNAI